MTDERSGLTRYRCHTGNSFAAKALLTSQTEKIEETLWVSMRMFEERKNLLNNLAKTETFAATRKKYMEQVNAAEVHIQRIRAMLVGRSPRAPGLTACEPSDVTPVCTHRLTGIMSA